ncbi:MAG: lysylphosphatidylglycerol synthase transmembrane domain-containing protein [Myxococcota bacterium]|nr:lysylphosphatidylglycerol synthase transmembrane domain-containing protein [Myxococcota bacterium]
MQLKIDPSGGGKPRKIRLFLKFGLTFLVFYFLLSHQIQGQDGEKIAVLEAMARLFSRIDLGVLVPCLVLATFIKCLGILCSMFRWYFLLIGQGVRFNFGHIFSSFLIGRFLGTFLPSTVGLDGYKFYDASRFSKRTLEVGAATVIEKCMGLTGLFLTFLVAFPFGAHILGQNLDLVTKIAVPLASGVVLLSFVLLWKPGWLEKIGGLVPRQFAKAEAILRKLVCAFRAYDQRTTILLGCFVLSFGVHFLTAAMYFFTALAVGASDAAFWEITFASSIQIFATVVSPFTIAGEGVRELVQALLLAKKIGLEQSILSAALGFWAAEAVTLLGGVFWWFRKSDYAPKEMVLEGADTKAVGERGFSAAALES